MLSDAVAARGWAPPIRCAITDRRSWSPHHPESQLDAVLRSSAHIVQWREKDLDAPSARSQILSCRKQAAQADKFFIVNGLIESALESMADGIHLTSRQDVEATRSRIAASGSPHLIIGKSVHDGEEALKAQDQGVHYLFLSPVLAPISKIAHRPPLGWRRFEEIVKRLEVPVFALGGLSPRHETQALRSGAIGFAGIGWVAAERAGVWRRNHERG